jgi:hypothetical protein
LKFLIIAVLLKSLMCIFYLPTVPTYHVSVNNNAFSKYVLNKFRLLGLMNLVKRKLCMVYL